MLSHLGKRTFAQRCEFRATGPGRWPAPAPQQIVYSLQPRIPIPISGGRDAWKGVRYPWPLADDRPQALNRLKTFIACGCDASLPIKMRLMGWKIEKQSNGLFAIYSSRVDDYLVIDATPEQIESIWAEKGAIVYRASAKMQLSREAAVSPEGEAKIEASRQRGSTPKESPDTPIGSTGYTLGDFEEE